jgi:hypothetical protein
MKTIKTLAIFLVALSIYNLSLNRLFAQVQDQKKWSFTQKDTIIIEHSSGSKFNFTTGNSKIIEIELIHSNDPIFTYTLKEEKNKIVLNEDVLNYNGNKPTPKSCLYWNLVLPKGITIISGGGNADLSVKDFTGTIINTGSQCHAKISNSKCNIKMWVSQCKVELENCAVSFDISCSQGDLYADEISITGKSSFTTGYGYVEVELSKPLRTDLTLSSNFGTVILDFNGNPVEGNFEFIARADKGKIVCPYKFDSEYVFKSKKMIYKNDADFKELVDYYVKCFVRGDQKPKIELKTVTGKVKVVG